MQGPNKGFFLVKRRLIQDLLEETCYLGSGLKDVQVENKLGDGDNEAINQGIYHRPFRKLIYLSLVVDWILLKCAIGKVIYALSSKPCLESIHHFEALTRLSRYG